MARAPRWKVYNAAGTYQAACKEPEAAAALMALYGDRATIRDGHGTVVWTEGKGFDGDAGESYDRVAETCYQRGGRTYAV